MYYWWYTGWYSGDSPAGQNPDQRLMMTVLDALFDDAAVTGEIDLNVQNGVVILDGKVGSESARTAVVARVWSVPGVADVCDALAVERRPGGRC